MLGIRALACALVVAVATAAAGAVQQQQPASAPLGALMACRAISEASARLACYDREVGGLSAAVAKRDVVVVDREGIRSTKRSLFGLSLPRLPILGGGDDDVSQVEGVLAGVGRNADGGYIFVLRDGASWSQIDDKPIALEPAAGDKVLIKRGALGSFLLNVNRQPGVKVRRTH